MPLLSATLLALALAAPHADSTALPRQQSPAQAGPRRTPEWAHDVGHFAGLAIATPSLALWMKELGVPRRTARWLAVGGAVTAIVLKEVHDKRVANSFSTRDVLVGGAGAAAGFAITVKLWPAEREPRSP